MTGNGTVTGVFMHFFLEDSTASGLKFGNEIPGCILQALLL